MTERSQFAEFFENEDQRRQRARTYTVRERVLSCLTTLSRVTIPDSAEKYRACLEGRLAPKDLDEIQQSTLSSELDEEFGEDQDDDALFAATTLDELIKAVKS